MSDKVLDFGSEYLNKEIQKFIDNNGGDGHRRILSIVHAFMEEGYTDMEIANVLKTGKYKG